MAGDKRRSRRGRTAAALQDAPLAAGALYRLMTWLSPAYPVGAFSHSSGIEWAVEAGDIADAAGLQDWLECLVTEGSGANDAILFVAAHGAAAAGDAAKLAGVTELAGAFVPSRERHLETMLQGRAFLEATRAACPAAALDLLPMSPAMAIAYPVAVATAAAGHAIPCEPALQAFLTAVTANWISAGVRLIPLGQTDAQHVARAVEPAVAATTRFALGATLDDLGSATFRSDLAGVLHETQYTRLFRT
jgi:urease accessory protein